MYSTKTKIATIAAASAFAFGLSACGSASADSANTVVQATTSASAMADGEFGAGCAAVPTDPNNPASFEAMAKVPVATAAAGNPLLSTLVTAVGAADLGDSLNSAQDITVFAPTNDAFAKIPKADLDAVLADKEQLTNILTYHVVPGKLTPETLAGTHTTLQGDTLTVTGSGTEFKVNDTAMVVCGNVQTANGTVYIIDGVLMPS
jgi:uncharacterized surface protein with fasciclin (FAS1) repeats